MTTPSLTISQPIYRCKAGHEGAWLVGLIQVEGVVSKRFCVVCAAEWAAEMFPLVEVTDGDGRAA